jgi:Enoyl-(Acyl carrier protein) reductase
VLNRYLVKRFITVEEVADLVAFLFGPSATSITGCNWIMDGGITPSYFASAPCRQKLKQFVDREKRNRFQGKHFADFLHRHPQLQDDFQKRTDYLAQKVAEHNYEDIRELRHRSIDSYEARQKINKLANVRGGNSRSGVMTVAFVCDAGQSVERVRQNVRVTY